MKKTALKPLDASQLCQKIDPKYFKFKTTAEIRERQEFVGQERAINAVHFGLGIKSEGYNLFAMGSAGIGKRRVITRILEAEAQNQLVPADWCYINNFEDAQNPIALQLPHGWGEKLREDMQILVEDLSNSIPVVFESEEYRANIQKISDDLNKRQDEMLKTISEEAHKEGIMIVSSAEGFTVMPVDKKGAAITAENFVKLSAKVQQQKDKVIAKFSQRLTHFLKQLPRLHKEHRKKEKQIKREFTLLAVGHFIDDLKRKYEKFPTVISYLQAVQQDVITNVKDFLKREESTSITFTPAEKINLSRYAINVLVDNSNTEGAPVIYEENPTYANLISRVEYITHFGTLTTNFTLIRAGALHEANGGYLVIDALKLLMNPYAWEGLKLALYTGKIMIEPPEHMVGMMSPTSLAPAPIPLNIKIVLLGDHNTYYSLCELDPDFEELFKVAVDFEEEVDRNEHNLQTYAQLIATLSHIEGLRAFDRAAVAAVVDHSSRLSEDTEKMSAHMRSINDLLREADYWASIAGQNIVRASEVKKAIDMQLYRLDRIKDQYFEQINRQFILLQTQGEKIGQINGLSLIELSNYVFGHPMRITATVRSGDGNVIDIQREVELSGPIHAKGVLILAGFIGGRYVQHRAFSMTASLVFEQTYGMVEGDSASITELCVLLSAIADVPIKQSLAITGSVNQHGEVQAIGGINEKIEGFFDACKGLGFNDKQGVIIPASNVKNLMLREDVVAAAAAKKFHIYPVKTVDEAMALLTGLPAGERGKNDKFSPGSINYLVEKRLEEFAKMKEDGGKKKSSRKRV